MSERLPAWFKKRIPSPGVMSGMDSMLDELRLHTVCQSALCPNIGDCFTRGTATFLVLGNICTRNCTFCTVEKGVPGDVDNSEPAHIAEAVARLGLRYVVLTSVTRDDLPDGGASHFAGIISLLKRNDVRVEVLAPDFGGAIESLKTVIGARPDVFNHNLETVPRLYPEVRPLADFERSVQLLASAKRLDRSVVTKSGVMVGLGETRRELLETMQALRRADCDILTLGQYLRPSPSHHPVMQYVSPEEFRELARLGEEMGFRAVASEPLVRSSFHAAELHAEVCGA